jgi:IS4 transposase
MFVNLDKVGNSNTGERLDLLEKFDEVFGFDRIKSLLADREFIGKEWFVVLCQSRTPFFIRMKENIRVPYSDKPLSVKYLFSHLRQEQSRLIEKEMYGHRLFFAGTHSKEDGLVIIMTNQNLSASQILSKYQKRWSIEELFRKLKTSGFLPI